MQRRILNPPRAASWIIEKFSRQYYQRSALGDLDEMYLCLCEESSIAYANRWYWRQALKSIPFLINNLMYWSKVMFKSYLKITFRNIRKQRGNSFINIAGLALGIACCILIMQYVFFELSYDKFHNNTDNIYRIAVKGKFAGIDFHIASASALMGPAFVEEFPEVLNSGRFKVMGRQMLYYKSKSFYEEDYLFADNSIFDIFSIEFISGDPESALITPYSLVLTEETAFKYFGAEDPIGKVIKRNDTFDCFVTGIVKKLPANSHFTFDALESVETLKKYDENQEYGDSFRSRLTTAHHTYLLLSEDTNIKELEDKMSKFCNTKYGIALTYVNGEMNLYLQQLKDIHLHSNLTNELGINSSAEYVYIFTVIAIFILIIACINFMNLSTARSSIRAREVGMRKVLGALRGHLVKQFFSESFIFSILSFVLALFIVYFAMPFFNNLAGREISVNYLEQPWLLIILFSLVIFVGIVSGSYPSVVLSSFLPVNVLKGTITKGTKGSIFRNTLVIFQFTISIILIIGTIVIYNQINFLKNKELGFDKEQLLVLTLNDKKIQDRAETLKNEMLSLPGVLSASLSSQVPGKNLNMNGMLPEGSETRQLFIMETINVDADFFKTFGLELILGREFTGEMETGNNRSTIINETAVKKLGLDDPIGKIINFPLSGNIQEWLRYTVIGVVKDFHTNTAAKKIEPLYLSNVKDFVFCLTMRLNSNNISNTVGQIRKKWKSFDPNRPFEYRFVDEEFNKNYDAQEDLSNVIRTFAALAIFIGCLGLFGLASFTVERRTKEVGIRKALGASSSGILIMLSRDFLKWIVISNLIAWPAAYLMMNRWLEDFAYRINIGIFTLILSGILAFTVAVGTVSYQALKAAKSNPVDALRYE